MDDTQVAIIGAGPAGLMLAHLLQLAGVELVVLELRSRGYVEARVRAGVLEDRSAALLRDAGVGARMDREGLVHRGIYLQFGGQRHRIDFEELTGRTILVYGQQEIVKDLIEARLTANAAILFEAAVLSIQPEGPAVTYVQGDETRVLRCELIAACDGSHGVGREAVAELYRNYGATGIVLQSADELAVHRDREASVVVLEYAVHGRVTDTGRAYDNRFVSVITVKDRKVTHWRDYLDPVAVFDALGWPSPRR